MSTESVLRGRIDASQDEGQPFNQNELNGSLAWIWGWDEHHYDQILRDRQSQRIFHEIFDWFDAHPHTNADLNIGMPPRSYLPEMTDIDRLTYLREMLYRRDRILTNLPEVMQFDFSSHHMFLEPETTVPEAGAVKFIVSVDVTPQDRMTAKMKIGQITVDIPDGILRINEVQRKDPAFGEEYQLEELGIPKEELEKKLRTKKKRLREIVKDDRLLPIVVDMDVAWPLIEELMMAQAVKALTENGVVSPDTSIQLLNEREIANSLEDPYTFDSVFEQTVGRALIESESEKINSIQITKEDKVKLMQIMNREGSFGDRAANVGYMLHYGLKFSGKDKTLRGLLHKRLLLSGIEKENEYAHLPLKEYAEILLPYTTDYFTNYAPYFLAFMDLSNSNRPYGRSLTQSGLARLHFWNQLTVK